MIISDYTEEVPDVMSQKVKPPPKEFEAVVEIEDEIILEVCTDTNT